MSSRKLLCLDFDGVLHSYASGWQGAAVVSDPPVPGAMEALAAYTTTFHVTVYSSRSKQEGGVVAMRHWLATHLVRELGGEVGGRVFEAIEWPTSKPPAVVTLDDRAITFRGRWPEPEHLAAFRPWDKGGTRALLVDVPDDALLSELSRRGLRYVRDYDPDGHCVSGEDLLREILADDDNAGSIVSRLRDGGFDLVRVQEAYPETDDDEENARG